MRVPWIDKILEANPSADTSMFGVYRPEALERPATPPPPLTGVLGELEPYRYGSTAQKDKKSKRRKSKAAPVPVVEQDTSVETDTSESVSPTNGPWPAHSVSPPTYSGPSYHTPSFPGYEDPEMYDTDSATIAANAQVLQNQFGVGSSVGTGHMVDSRLVVRSTPPLPPFQPAVSPLPHLPGAFAYPSVQYIESSMHNMPASYVPRTYATHPAGHPSIQATHIQAQEGYSTPHTRRITMDHRPSIPRTQGGRTAIARSDPSMTAGSHQPPTQRYNPYARRLPQMAPRNQAVEQGAPAIPTYPVGPYWGATPNEQAVPNRVPPMPRGEGFVYPPQVAMYIHPSATYQQTTPVRTSSSSWSAPTLHTSAVRSQPSATMYRDGDPEWSPTDEAFEVAALQCVMDHAYNSGPSTSRRV